jgi:hypothetical protein
MSIKIKVKIHILEFKSLLLAKMNGFKLPLDIQIGLSIKLSIVYIITYLSVLHRSL